MMEIEKLIERLDGWDGVDAIYKGKFVEANCRIASRLLEEAASALEQLQAENERVKAERDLAIKQLRGYCHACKNYTPNHNEGPCAGCKHEYFQCRNADARENWEWIGVKEE